MTCDVTSDESVAALAEAAARAPGPVTLLVNNAGGARGLDPVESGSVADWQWMYDVNVLGTLRVTKALLPALEASGAGTIVVVSSTAGLIVYEGGGGYTAAKHAQTAMAGTLRLELCGRPVRVIEIDPGMVRTDEFAAEPLRRRRGPGRRGLRRGGGAAGRRGRRRLHRLVRHPPAARQHRPAGGPPAGPGRPAQGAPGSVPRSEPGASPQSRTEWPRST